MDTAGTERMVITSGGDLAIGSTTADPLGLSFTGTGLTINEDWNTFIQLDGGNGSRIEFGQSEAEIFHFLVMLQTLQNLKEQLHPMVFSTNNTERMRIDGSGNVGIGTSSPDEKLDVAGNVVVNNGGFYKFGDGTVRIYGETSTDIMSFVTNDSERMRINSSGNLGVGNTNVLKDFMYIQHQ